jgi:hypothetical protein
MNSGDTAGRAAGIFRVSIPRKLAASLILRVAQEAYMEDGLETVKVSSP